MRTFLALFLLACGPTEDPQSLATDRDQDGLPEGRDCDDDDPAIHPGAKEIWYDGVDQDCDGWSDWDADADGEDIHTRRGGTDCDDTRPDVNTAAREIWYDGVDSDCNDLSDYDQDGDGHDSQPYGDDCDDDDDAVSPSASETWYDDVDQDCDGNDDDKDGDGYDGGRRGADCDDDDLQTHPGGTEVWYDGIDQDCDGNDGDQDGDGQDAVEVGGTDCDDLDPEQVAVLQFDDLDGDGFGLVGTGTWMCPVDPDKVLRPGDCDDTDPSISPSASEIWYDGIDQDCLPDNEYDADGDGLGHADHGGADCDDTDPAVTFYSGFPDLDEDGDGDETAAMAQTCDPRELSSASGDCDDSDPTISSFATEVWYDGVDQDCDGNDGDQDGDGFAAEDVGGPDCDDLDPSIRPRGGYLDQDGDGFGAEGGGTLFCDESGYVAVGGDCDDDDASVHPGAAEIAGDGIDQDCDGDARDRLSDFAVTVLTGTEAGGLAGTALASADLDGDGTAELAVGAPWAPGSGSWSGAVFVRQGPVTASGSLTTGALALEGHDSGLYAGVALASGDLDGDGVASLVVAGPSSSASWAAEGMVYLWSDGFDPSTHDLSDSAALIEADQVGEDLGYGLATGDTDGDGAVELWVAAASTGTIARFEAPSGHHLLSDAAHWIEDSEVRTWAGAGLDAGSDLDGDGVGDLVVASHGKAGSVDVYLGPVEAATYSEADTRWTAETDTGREDPAGLWTRSDVDGDGQLDVLVGVPPADGMVSQAGVVAVLLDPAGAGGDLADADAGLLGAETGDMLGTSLALVRIDGTDLLLVGAPGAEADGALLVTEVPLAGSVSADSAPLGFHPESGSTAELGTSLVLVDDQDGDGAEEIWLGLPGDDTEAASAGAAALLYSGDLP